MQVCCSATTLTQNPFTISSPDGRLRLVPSNVHRGSEEALFPHTGRATPRHRKHSLPATTALAPPHTQPTLGCNSLHLPPLTHAGPGVEARGRVTCRLSAAAAALRPACPRSLAARRRTVAASCPSACTRTPPPTAISSSRAAAAAATTAGSRRPRVAAAAQRRSRQVSHQSVRQEEVSACGGCWLCVKCAAAVVGCVSSWQAHVQEGAGKGRLRRHSVCDA